MAAHSETLGTDLEHRGESDERGGNAEDSQLGRYEEDDVKTAPWPPRQA